MKDADVLFVQGTTTRRTGEQDGIDGVDEMDMFYYDPPREDSDDIHANCKCHHTAPLAGPTRGATWVTVVPLKVFRFVPMGRGTGY